MPIPIYYWCEVATEGYVIYGGKLKEKQRTSSPDYHKKLFTFDCVEQFQWLVEQLRESPWNDPTAGDDAMLEFTNTWGHLIYSPSEEIKPGVGQPKETIFDMPYRLQVDSLRKQIEHGYSPIKGRAIELDYHMYEGVLMPCAKPWALFFAIFMEYKTNPPQDYITCQYYINNGNQGRAWRGSGQRCPVGCRVRKTHPKQKWYQDKCRKAWEMKQYRGKE